MKTDSITKKSGINELRKIIDRAMECEEALTVKDASAVFLAVMSELVDSGLLKEMVNGIGDSDISLISASIAASYLSSLLSALGIEGNGGGHRA